MKMLQKAEIRRAAARYGLLLLGTAILSFGLYNVHSQSQITEGGVFGTGRSTCTVPAVWAACRSSESGRQRA